MAYQIKSTVEDTDLIEKRRAQIVTAATRLFAAHGYFRTTIKDIATAAGISQGGIYQYVSEKEDVLLLVLFDVLDTYARDVPVAIEGITDPLERCIAVVRTYCRVVDRRRKATVLAYRSTQSLSENRRTLVQARELETNKIVAGVVEECIAAGYLRPVNVNVLTYQIVMMAHAWALKYWTFKTQFTVETYFRHFIDIIFYGALTDEGSVKWQQLRDDLL
jgi:AcrR family transcriptional regulator